MHAHECRRNLYVIGNGSGRRIKIPILGLPKNATIFFEEHKIDCNLTSSNAYDNVLLILFQIGGSGC